MTAEKQVSITSPSHMKNAARYLNDERAVGRGSQNMIDPSNWEKEMERTRIAYGHDVPSRAGAANCIGYHRVLAFNPDECSLNGGKMTANLCMEYARKYAATYLPNQECIWVLHREHCAADQVDRWAIHLIANRTDLKTGKRFNMGRARQAKIERANQVRELDREFGLKQMVANERNCAIHARQPTKAEKRLEESGIRTDKRYIREAVRATVTEVRKSGRAGNEIQELARGLDAKGVRMTRSKRGKSLTFERKKTGLRVNGTALGRGFSMAGIAKGLGIELCRQTTRVAEQEMER